MFEDRTSTRELYNETASRWGRGKLSSLSDFTIYPVVREPYKLITRRQTLELGCSNRYCSVESIESEAKAVLERARSEGTIARGTDSTNQRISRH